MESVKHTTLLCITKYYKNHIIQCMYIYNTTCEGTVCTGTDSLLSSNFTRSPNNSLFVTVVVTAVTVAVVATG